MNQNGFALNNQAYANNNNILLGIMNELQQIINYSKEDLTIKRISDIIIKINFFFNEYKKNHESIMNQFSLLQNQLNQLNQNLKINNKNNHQEIKYGNGRYTGQVVNGLKEGKGIFYWNDGDRYEGDFRNGKSEGKGIYYYNKYPFKGDKYEGDFVNWKKEGKGIYYHENGNRYEGDFRNDKKEGKGIYYYNNGDRIMGNYNNDKQIGKHVMMKNNGEVITYNY